MKHYALIGYPLGHSLSPQIHTRLLGLSGIEGDYEKIEISPEELESKYDYLSSFDGFNITIPHKISIIGYTDEIDSGAERYRSVNCVKNGERKTGYNTDVYGFTRSIDMLGASLESRVLLIGCGGVGRMMAIETALGDGKLTVAVLENAEEAAKTAKAEILSRKPDADVEIIVMKGSTLSAEDFGGNIPDFDLLLNATPVGMHPNTDAMPCTEEIVEHCAAVFDVIYNPKVTKLAETAKNMGKSAMTGMAMLVLQAAKAHEIWNGSEFSDSDLKKLISDMEELV